jgi:hypothetical protein
MKKTPPTTKTVVLNVRDLPADLVANFKAAAALHRMSLKHYLAALLQTHVNELQQQGVLPKGRG